MVVPLLLLVRILVSSGLDVATIQEGELNGPQISSLFWVNQAMGLVMALITGACAPLLAWFYGASEVGPLTVALAGVPIAMALGTQHQALLQRHMRLGAMALVQLLSLILGGIAGIAAAMAHWGVWALVVQRYGELLTLALLSWRLEPWRPSFHLRGTGSRHLVRLGGNYTLSSLMFYLISNVDKVLVGFFLGETSLALYSQAFNLMMRPAHIVITPLTGIMLPTLSRAAGDPRQYTQLTLGFFRFIGLVGSSRTNPSRPGPGDPRPGILQRPGKCLHIGRAHGSPVQGLVGDRDRAGDSFSAGDLRRPSGRISLVGHCPELLPDARRSDLSALPGRGTTYRQDPAKCLAIATLAGRSSDTGDGAVGRRLSLVLRTRGAASEPGAALP
jgi:hypothetical protein